MRIPSYRSKRLLTVVISLLFVMTLAARTAAVAEAAEPLIAVLVSGQGAPYDDTLAGLQQHLANSGVKARFDVRQLGGDVAKTEQAILELKTIKPDIIVTLGTLATEKAIKDVPEIPVVAAMILRPDMLKKSRNATGVLLEFSVETQLQWLKKVLPKARTVGVVFNAAENREKVEAAARDAVKLGLRLEAKEVPSPTDLPAALERLANSADALWGIPDSVTLTPQTAKLILLFSFRNHIPFAGPSSAWVKAGALYALDWDYKDMGAQCGEMVHKVLQGTPAASIRPSAPRKTFYSLNRKTAEDLGIKFSDELLKGARTVF